MWFFVALSGYAISSVVNILDKFVLDKTVRKPVAFVFYSTIFALLFLLLIPLKVGLLNCAFDYGLAILAGLTFVLGLWASYTGIQKSEVSHMGPFIGAVIPIFVFVFSFIFLNEYFLSRQLLAIVLLVFGSFIIALEKSKRHNGFQKGAIWGLLGGFLWAIFAVAAKYLYGRYDFVTGFVWTQGMVGASALLLLFFPGVRNSLSGIFRPVDGVRDWKKGLFVMIAKLLGVIGLILVQYASSLGSVTIVYALAGFQYALLIILVGLLSKFYSKFFKEKYSRWEIIQEIIAVLIIVVGLALLAK
ncbi:MAG: hypothetical protein COU29_00970 [Candidatus Magasanikbacteria bacterium CG10_big_fil_rev_8_21_14_0_10_36_32]|uniref:EamA domain-containing protein n=1 Tax=Candidatus Magasanikbacteria bacterium CG10_big_fil_rev_8_21_14_0_10_36_32 TaxID=1974646 RepID=A0A2M6W6C1_9BACT|nr:MAG: hypothetical protein COU29_00970 [Candidatus Magasanikbacteria bacterium CG10_big_fil_rev_8_21_14_0_10_36_32]